MDSHQFKNDSHESVIGSSGQFADYSHSSWLLVEIERQLASLSKEDQEATLLEVEEHLRCSRVAMEEMGFDQATADRETVALFGSPSEFCKKLLNRAQKPTRKQPALYWLTAAIMLYVCSFGIFTYYNMPLLWVGVAVGCTTFVFLSWRARTFQWKGLLFTGVATTLFLSFVMGFAWVSMWDAGGMGESPRWQLRSLSKEMQSQHAKVQAAYKELDPIWHAYSVSRDSVEESTYFANGSYVQFEPSEPYWLGDFSYKLLWTPNYEDALKSWRAYHNSYRGYLVRIDSDVANFSAIDVASKQLFTLRPAFEGVAAGSVMAGIALLLNCVVAFLRWIYDQLRRLPRPRAA